MDLAEEPLFNRLGESNLQLLVDRFYDLVFDNPQISHLFKTDKSVIKEKQRLFLTQFLGGPPLYSSQYGHPRLRARHLPHTITADDAVAWLSCMSDCRFRSTGRTTIEGRIDGTTDSDGNVYGEPGMIELIIQAKIFL